MQPAKILAAEEVKISAPTLEKIFSPDHNWTTNLSADKKRVIIATGDIIPARSVNAQANRYKDFNWPYLKTAAVLQETDITFANLETPFIKQCPVTMEGMIFCGDYRNVVGLNYAGVDAVSLANNHAGNYGKKGIEETVGYLKNAGIETTGTVFSNLIIKDIRGIRFAFLGFNDIAKTQPGVINMSEESLKSEIAYARGQADVVVVTIHWGAEYQPQPDERQKYLGHLAIDAGADLVIGNHPHWIQPVEFYKGKLVTYAHGNFVFDQEWSLETKQGIVGKYTFYDKQLVDVEFLPVLIEDYGQPRFLEGKEKRQILEEMKMQSEILAGLRIK